MGTAASKPPIMDLKQLNDSIYIFHDPADQNKEITATFIFFHCVQWTGDEKAYVQTWMSGGSPSICWPKVWLSAKYPEALILSASYDAGLYKEKSSGLFRMDSLAENLRQDILELSTKSCPIFLIGHGLGGIVIKAVIRSMQRKRDALNICGSTRKDLTIQLDGFLENVRGTCFYNTPCQGSKFVNSIPNKGPLLDTLEVLNTDTCELNNYFRDWRINKQCTTTTIFALLHTDMSFWYGGSPLAWMKLQCTLLNWLWTKKQIQLVEEGAARYDADDFYTAVKSDHFSVCKPQSEMASSYKRLIELIDGGMQRASCDPDRKKWTKYVESILRALPNLGGNVLQLKIDHLEQVGRFRDIFDKLINGLKGAGFKKLGNHGKDELWERASRAHRHCS